MNTLLRATKNPSKFVYIMHEPFTTGRPLVKVGISDNPERRLRENTTGSPYDLVLRTSFDCGDERTARDIEKETHRRFKEQQTKARTGEWLSAAVETVEEYVVSLVREHCQYDPHADERVLEQRREYFSSMGVETDEDDELFEDDETEMQDALKRGRLRRLARLLPVDSSDAPFFDWYMSQWKPFRFSTGLERLTKSTLQKILNIDALINAMDSEDCYEDWELDDRVCRQTVTENAIEMWREYKASRRLSEKELKLLFRQMDEFVKAWGERTSDRKAWWPSESIAGRWFHGYSDPKPKDRIRIQLGLGVSLDVLLKIPSSELTEPDVNRLKSGGRRFCLSHIAEAWVEGWPGHQSVVRHQAGIQIREMALEVFLKSQCGHCFGSYILNQRDYHGPFLVALRHGIVVEQERITSASAKTRSLFISHAEFLMSDALQLATRAWRLYRGDKRLESEIITGEFDHISEENIEELDVDDLLWTMINGISSAGDQLCRNRQIFPDIYYDARG